MINSDQIIEKLEKGLMSFSEDKKSQSVEGLKKILMALS